MNSLHLAAAAMTCCLVMIACSRRDSTFSLSPVHHAVSAVPASAVEACVFERWSLATRKLRIKSTGDARTLRAHSFFEGVSIGLRIRHADGATRVEYYERRHARPVYWSMVAGCLVHDRAAKESGGPVGPRS